MVKSIEKIVEQQKNFFNSQITQNLEYRINALNKLNKTLKKYQNELIKAIKKDNNKSETETILTEFLPVYDEIKYMKKNIKKLSKTEKVSVNIYNQMAKGYIYKKPYGVILNISSWNFPINLTLIPLVGAIATGNCCILKVSEYSKNIAIVLRKMLKEVFAEEYICVLNGDKEQVQKLINAGVNYIFFTGSNKVGKIIMESASKKLIPVTLELGGKSPCIVTKNANIDVAARRIVWGKYLNAGQVCVAPDYCIVEESIKEEFVAKCKENIIKNYYENGVIKKEYPHIITKEATERLIKLIEEENILVGGNVNLEEKCIEPTIVELKKLDSKIMEEEIFGPIMPIITYKNESEIEKIIHRNKEPLAFYIFTNDNKEAEKYINKYLAGSMCVNDTVVQIINENMPFGGVLNSGIGRYHGKYSFDTFTHKMSVMKKKGKFDLPFKYNFNNKTNKLLNILIKLRY